MTPLDLIAWSFMGGVAVVIFSVGLSIGVALVSLAVSIGRK